MAVDVVTETVIARPRLEVAAFASDPERVPLWHANIRSVEWKTEPPVRVGSRIAFVAHFLGRKWIHTYEVVEVVAGERFVMRTAEGPFPMETTYTWRTTDDGGTAMTLRNRVVPTGISRLVAPFKSMAMRRANTKDLVLLKAILERRTARSHHVAGERGDPGATT